MALVVVTLPVWEPISLDQAKQHLRVDTDDDDELIYGFIVTAREMAEEATGRAIPQQVVELNSDTFQPDPWRIGANGEAQQVIIGSYAPAFVTAWTMGTSWSLVGTPGQFASGGGWDLPGGLVQSVDSIKYTDQNAAQTTLDPSVYTTDLASQPARVRLAYGQDWPQVVLQSISGIKVRYTAGWASADVVPHRLKTWMLMQIGSLYENREESSTDTRLVAVDLGPLAKRLINGLKVTQMG